MAASLWLRSQWAGLDDFESSTLFALIDESIALHAVASAAFCAKSATPQPVKASDNGTAIAIDFIFMEKRYWLFNWQLVENVEN